MFCHLVTRWTVQLIYNITDNRLAIVGITEIWLSNDDKKQHVSGFTHHRPRNTGIWGGRVGVLINNQVKFKSRIVCVNPEIASLDSMELVITISSITIRLSVIYRMQPGI